AFAHVAGWVFPLTRPSRTRADLSPKYGGEVWGGWASHHAFRGGQPPPPLPHTWGRGRGAAAGEGVNAAQTGAVAPHHPALADPDRPRPRTVDCCRTRTMVSPYGQVLHRTGRGAAAVHRRAAHLLP